MAELSFWQRDLLVLILLGLTNFLPILGNDILKGYLSAPIDLGYHWIDGRPLFGPHKTWRGLVIAVIGTGLASYFTPIAVKSGFDMAIYSMSGDLISSFVKRRLGLKSGQGALLLDQGPESLLPLWILKDRLSINWMEISLIVTLFIGLEIGLSPLLYALHIRRNPH
ncbi:MAG: CDP-archaeol synthase [Nitrospiraceae bacterium]|nr:CDP-archaeol synthase [Nitrospiraceae bacterium]